MKQRESKILDSVNVSPTMCNIVGFLQRLSLDLFDEKNEKTPIFSLVATFIDICLFRTANSVIFRIVIHSKEEYSGIL